MKKEPPQPAVNKVKKSDCSNDNAQDYIIGEAGEKSSLEASYYSETLSHLDFMNKSTGLTQILMEVSFLSVTSSLLALLSSDKSSLKYYKVRSFSLCVFLDVSREILGT